MRRIIIWLSVLILCITGYSLYRFHKRNEMFALEKQLISKYSYAIKQNNDNFVRKPELENKIWMLWLQGEENAPDMVKASINSVKVHSGGRDVIVLNEDNINKYVDIPDYVWKAYKEKRMNVSHFADIVRFYLMYNYGGTWVDASIILDGELPNDIQNSDVFMFKPLQTDKRRKKYYVTEDWFIHANPNNNLIKYTLNMLLEYWKHEQRQHTYFLTYAAVACVVNNNVQCKKLYEEMPDYKNNFSFVPYIRKTFDDVEYNNIRKTINDGAPVIKLSHHEKEIGGAKQVPNSYYNYFCKKYANTN